MGAAAGVLLPVALVPAFVLVLVLVLVPKLVPVVIRLRLGGVVCGCMRCNLAATGFHQAGQTLERQPMRWIDSSAGRFANQLKIRYICKCESFVFIFTAFVQPQRPSGLARPSPSFWSIEPS
jgi:hypothetical protein